MAEASVPELSVVLLGNSWKQRSFVGNLLLKDDAFDTERQSKYTVKIITSLQNKRISVTITPDLLEPDLPEDRLTELIANTAASAPGPHVFLLVLQPEDFTEQQKNALQSVLERLSDQPFQSSLLLISTPREETPGFMEKYMSDPQIRDMIIKCRYRYQWMNYTDDLNMKEFKHEELLARIGEMMEKSEEHVNIEDSNTQQAKTGQTTGSSKQEIILNDNTEEEIKAALQNNDLALAAEKSKKYLDELKNIRLNIAITGESGSGKSTLVNALRGITNKTEGAAPTGVKETTMKPTEYFYSSNPNVRIWDLPGIGTTRFTAHEYLKHVGFEKYDFFIIVSSHRFRENDAQLAQEIQKMKKKFYFVRSQIDINIRNEKEEDPNVKEEDVLKLIRNNCTEELQKLGFESPKVFLVSGFSLHLYEFKDLCQTLEMELNEHQRNVLLLALPNISLDVIVQKKQSLESKIIWYTLASVAVAAVPVPFLSDGVDLGMIVTFTKSCVNSLGLTPESLQKLSAVTGVPLKNLMKELKSPLAGAEVTPALVLNVLTSSSAHITAIIVDVAKFVPIIGTVFVMPLTGVTTHKVLSYILNTLAEDAQRVFIKAMCLSTSA